METLLQDLRYGARMLMKKPGFTFIAALTLALGIGATTAIFSVVDAVILKSLPFASPEELMAIGTTRATDRSRFGVASYPDFEDWRTQQSAFERMAAYYTRGFTFQSDGGAVRLQGAVVNADIFPLLGIQPFIGRALNPEEDKAGGGRVALLSYSLWQNRFNADQQIVGHALSLNGESFTIAGVMPQGFQYPIQSDRIELWANMAMDAESTDGPPRTEQRGNHYLNVIGRLKPGATIEQAETQLVSIAANLEQQYPNENDDKSARVRPLMEDLTGDVSQSLLIILAAVVFVLLIACSNVVNLLLARAAGRRREIAVRAALGASRLRVIRQLLTESTLLALLGGAGGILLASFGMDALIALNPVSIPRLAEAAIDGRVLLFTLLTATITGVVMGVVPAWHASNLDLQTVLKEGGRGASEGTSRFSARNMLIVAEVALALVLLLGAGLLLQSFARLTSVNPGFDTERLLTLRIGFPDGLYTEPRQISQFHDRLMTSLESLPGVAAYSTVAPTPLSGSNYMIGFSVKDRPNQSGRQYPYDTRFMLIGSNYFRTLGVSFRQGRDYTARDNMESSPVVIINESFARRHFPNENPIGQYIDPSIGVGDGTPMREIIGIVADSRSRHLSAEPEPELYLHIPQVPALGSMMLMLRAQSDPQSLMVAARQEVMNLDSNVPIYDIKAFDEYLADSVAQPRFNSFLLSLFAGVALLLTAIGLYGVVAYSVSQRTQEIAIRLALGARTGDVLRLIVGQGMALVVIGVVIGLIGGFTLTRLMESLLFGVSATDPVTFAVITALLTAVALLACYLPARRVTKVDPMVALRYE